MELRGGTTTPWAERKQELLAGQRMRGGGEWRLEGQRPRRSDERARGWLRARRDQEALAPLCVCDGAGRGSWVRWASCEVSLRPWLAGSVTPSLKNIRGQFKLRGWTFLFQLSPS